MSHAGAESTLSPFTASDGDNLAVQDWYLPEGVAQRGAILLVHGLGEHAGRYDPMAKKLNEWGFIVRGYDQYGHGESDGVRGGLPHPNRLLDDLADLVESTRVRNPGVPLVVIGHSLGGLVILAMLAEHTEIPVHRVVLLGSPYADSAAVHGMERFGWSRRAIGRSVRDWLKQPRPAIPDGVELGVIAGDLPVGLGRVFVRMPAASDGVVLVEETHVPGARDSILLHISHSAMLISPAVAAQVCAFLATGRFAR